jgi:hypothetical protein
VLDIRELHDCGRGGHVEVFDKRLRLGGDGIDDEAMLPPFFLAREQFMLEGGVFGGIAAPPPGACQRDEANLAAT